MSSSLRSRGILLLALFALGGVLAPTVHKAGHGLDWENAKSKHLADHHHHARSGEQSHRVLPPCPARFKMDLACALCQGLAAAAVEPGSVVADEVVVAAELDPLVPPSSKEEPGRILVRGPPEQVA